MATTRAEKRALNRARWQAGERWNAAETPLGNEPAPPDGANGNGASADLSFMAPAKRRSNKWVGGGARARGLNGGVYEAPASLGGGGRGFGQAERLRLAAAAATPEDARWLAAGVAWPCRCGSGALPERWFWGVMCCKCGRFVLYVAR